MDDTPTLQAMLDAVPDGGLELALPAQTYNLATTWRITRPDITIRGAGIGKTKLVRDPMSTGLMVDVAADGVALEDMSVDNNGASATSVALRRDNDVTRVQLANFGRIGFAAFGAVTIADCLLVNDSTPTVAVKMGIWHDGENDLTVMRNFFSGNNLYANGGRIVVAHNHFIRNHPVAGTGGGQITIGNGAKPSSTDCDIIGNLLEYGAAPIVGGMELGSGRFLIQDNIVRNHGCGGIGLGVYVNDARVIGNTIYNNGRNIAERNRPQNRWAIGFTRGARNISVVGNVCYDDQVNKTQTYGVAILPYPLFAAPQDNLYIADNILTGNSLGGILDYDQATNKVIVNNVI